MPGGDRTKVVGTRVPRIEDERFLTGRGTYVADLEWEDMVHAAFLPSPYAHARLRHVDVSRARTRPGVLASFSGAELKAAWRPIPAIDLDDAEAFHTPAYWPLPVEAVHHAGQAVAVVVAKDAASARDALEDIEVAYDPLPTVLEAEAALRPGAPQLHPKVPGNLGFRWTLQGGDAGAAFRQADVVVERRLVNPRLQPAPMEPDAAVASWDAGTGRLTLWVTSQNPHDIRSDVAKCLRLTAKEVRVVSPDVGGGFGAKVALYPQAAVVAHLARVVGRPVRWVATRTENFQTMTHGRDQVQDVRLAATWDGTILGLRVRAYANLGAYLSTAGAVVPSAPFGEMLSGCYRMRAVEAEVLGAYTNTAPTGPYRGAGRPEAAYLVERMVDLLARKLGMDPSEIRRRNFVPRDAFPYAAITGRTYDSGDYAGTMDKALAFVGYARLREEQARAREEGRLVGIGLSTYVEMCGVGPGMKGHSTVRVTPQGRVLVRTGAMPHGQGGATMLAQIVGEALGVPVELVDVLYGDTDAVPRGVGTFGSRTTAIEGASVAMSAAKVVEKARRLAAHFLEARPEDVVFEAGRFHVRGVEGPSRTVAQVAVEAGAATRLPSGLDPALEASSSFDPEDFVYPFGTHVCVVEVERETGIVDILRYLAVDDVGKVVNPMIVEGQVHGGVLQGIAQALWEEARYDGDGNLLTSSFLEYAMPTATEAPTIETERTVTPTSLNVLGAKGVGETGSIAAPAAVVNAVVDALSALGIEHLDMPLTPEKVWRAIREAEGR
jgi:carbon-monoxide dehydrogenase large subunit